MIERIRPHFNHATVVAYLALFAALGGGAFAATGGFASRGGELRGCVDRGGHLTLLKAGKSCGRHRTQVAWSVRGPQGAKGAAGARGPAGAQGLGGAPGAEGQAGRAAAGAKSFEVSFAPKTTGVVTEAEGIQVKGDCENIVAGKVGLSMLSRNGLYWEKSALTPKVDEEGFVLDEKEVGLDVFTRREPASPGPFVHFQIVGRVEPGGCVFSGVVTPTP